MNHVDMPVDFLQVGDDDARNAGSPLMHSGTYDLSSGFVCPCTRDPSATGLACFEEQLVLQSRVRINAGLTLLALGVYTQLALVLKKKQFERLRL